MEANEINTTSNTNNANDQLDVQKSLDGTAELPFFDAIQSLNTNSAIVPTLPDPSKDILVILYTCSRILAAVAFMTAAVNIHDDEPGVHYMVAGVMLIASLVTEYLAEAIDRVTACLGLAGSFMVVIGGSMAFNRRAIDVDVIGVMWTIAALFLLMSHSYDAFKTYKKVNPILISSKIAAMVASLCFIVGGVMMVVMDDLAPEEFLYRVYNIFTIGGVAYLIHAVNMFTGHTSIVNRIFIEEQRVVHLNSKNPEYV